MPRSGPQLAKVITGSGYRINAKTTIDLKSDGAHANVLERPCRLKKLSSRREAVKEENSGGTSDKEGQKGKGTQGSSRRVL